MKEKLTITIDENVILNVKALAKQEQRSVSNMVEVLIKKALGLKP
jgi:predicted CopG family antitoxin